MQFSVFGVHFRFSREIFGGEQLKQTLCAYWALAWRGMLLGGIIGGALIFNTDLREALWESLLYQALPSSEFWLSIDGFLFVALLVVLFLGVVYIQYYGLFKKNYKSFQRKYSDISVSKTTFFSKNFWLPWLLTAVLGFIVAQVFRGVFERILPDSYVLVLSIFIGVLLFHFYLHGGTWGFVPQKRES